MNFLNQMNKYVLYTSVILNGVLLMVVTGVIPFLLYLSALVNLVLFWYVARFLIKLEEVEEDISYIFDKTEEFAGHLEEIHALEMYYGDENLQKLIVHSRELINEYVDIQEKHFDAEVIEYEEPEEDDSEEEG
jgi:hypothetical protein